MARSLLLVLLFLAAANQAEGPFLTHGIASGDVTDDSAILWARASADAMLECEYDTTRAFSRAKRGPSVRVTGETDFTGQILLKGLRPATQYFYKIRARSKAVHSPEATGSFATAPRPNDSRDVRFLWAGDLGGQGRCRRPEQGYTIFEAMAGLAPDFVLFSGDMIYADSPCPAPPNLPGSELVAGTLAQYRQRWKYNREDAYHQKLLASTSMITQWDDHEVVNDFAGPFESLMPVGRRAYFEYHPVARSRGERHRIYRKLRWGKELAVFLLDNRQYRAANTMPDGPQKSMLGRAQYDWLLRSLSQSDAVWKIIATSVPLTVPTGTDSQKKGRDGWANGSAASRPEGNRTGWEHELLSIFQFVRRKNIRNVVWVTTDVHFAQFARLDPFGDGHPLSYELICGPLSAIALKPAELDTTLRPTRLYAEGEFFNFGAISIDAKQHRLTAEIHAGSGEVRHALVLEADNN